MGLPYPCVVLINTSAMPVASQRAIRLRGVKCGITRVSLTCFTRSWDRAILDAINTWIDLGSDPMSSLRCWDHQIVFGLDSLGAGRAVRLRGMMCGITRVSLTCFVRSWDRAIPTRNKTWVNMVSDPMSCSRVVPVPVSARIACHRWQTYACVCGIASARALC